VGRAPPARRRRHRTSWGQSAGDGAPYTSLFTRKTLAAFIVNRALVRLTNAGYGTSKSRRLSSAEGSVQGLDDLVPADIQVFSRRRGTPAATRTQPLATCQSQNHQLFMEATRGKVQAALLYG
jgi:hypothetical protein